MKQRTEPTVRYARMDRQGVCFSIQLNQIVHRFEGQKELVAVRYVVKAVTGTEYLEAPLLFDKILYLSNGTSRVEVLGAVFQVTCPVFQFSLRPSGEER